MRPAILLLEFRSIALGIQAADAMVKRAPVATLHAGSVHPGKYLVLAGGEVGHVEEARVAGREVGAAALVDEIYLPDVHSEVVRAIAGRRAKVLADAVGVIETRTVAAVIAAADAGVKGAAVELNAVHLADGLGGKGYCVFGGAVSAVEAAVAIGIASLTDRDELVARVVIPRLHEEMRHNLNAHAEFLRRVTTYQPKSWE